MQRTSAATILLFFAAILFGLFGVYTFRKLAQPRVAQRSSAPDKVTVPLASRHLESGRVVALSDVALVRMTKAQMKERGIRGMFMSDPQQIIGSTVMTAISRDETFHTKQFFPDGYRPNVTDRLKTGQRAVTVMMSSEDALNGYATSGQVVDIIFRMGLASDGANGAASPRQDNDWDPRYGYHANSGGGGSFSYTYNDRIQGRNGGSDDGDGSGFAATTVTLMQGVEILALENNTVKSDAQEVPQGEEIRVTIAVTPEQAETLRVVEGHGLLSLALRNPHDNEIIESITAKSLDQILGKSDFQSAAPPPVEYMEIYRGSSYSRVSFDDSHPLAIQSRPQRWRYFKNAPQVKPPTSANDREKKSQTRSVSMEDVFERESE